MSQYTDAFYDEQHALSLRSARKILSLLLQDAIPKSVIDIGCGVGTWLRACSEMGTRDILGIDGDYVPRDRLMIPETNFCPGDVSAPLTLERRFDLAISMEVIEHLPLEAAPRFVANLTQLSDVVLFSGAMPYQGGTGHLNENWPYYWARLFAVQGYDLFDIIRPALWQDADIAFWYRQNAFVFARPERTYLPDLGRPGPRMPLDAIHPEMYLLIAEKAGMGKYKTDQEQLAILRSWYSNGGPPPNLTRLYGPQHEKRYDGPLNRLLQFTQRIAARFNV